MAATATAPKQVTQVVLPLVKETANTFVFGVDKETAKTMDVSTIYVRKSAFARGKAPKAITVTISV